MPVTFEMTNWTDTTFEATNWTDAYPIVDPSLEEFVNDTAFNQTIEDVVAEASGYTFTNRHVAMGVVPHFTGLLSLLGSALIVWDVYSKRFKSVYDRLLFGLAVSDIIASLGMALSTWPVPEYQGQKTWGAVGNIHSCEFQGFIIQLGLATPLYSAALSIYYVMLVKFNLRPDSYQMLRFEKISHIFATSLAVITAVISLAMKQYNNANIWCWIAPYPYGCEDTGTCERGNHATMFRMVFYFSWLWLSFIVVTVSMCVLAYTVIAQMGKMDRYRQKGQKRSKMQTDRIRNVVTQSALYILAFMITALPLSVARIYQAKYSCSSTFFPLTMTTVTVFPLQGFWNAIIYFRTRFTKHLTEGQLGKRMSAVISNTINSSRFGSSIGSFGNFSHGSNGSLKDLFKSRSSKGGRNSTQVTSRNSGSGHSSNASLGFGLDMSDSENEDENDGSKDKGWSVADIQKVAAAQMKDASEIDESTKRLQHFQAYLDGLEGSAKSATQARVEEEDDDEEEEEEEEEVKPPVVEEEPEDIHEMISESKRDVEMDGSRLRYTKGSA